MLITIKSLVHFCHLGRKISFPSVSTNLSGRGSCFIMCSGTVFYCVSFIRNLREVSPELDGGWKFPTLGGNKRAMVWTYAQFAIRTVYPRKQEFTHCYRLLNINQL